MLAANTVMARISVDLIQSPLSRSTIKYRNTSIFPLTILTHTHKLSRILNDRHTRMLNKLQTASVRILNKYKYKVITSSVKKVELQYEEVKEDGYYSQYGQDK